MPSFYSGTVLAYPHDVHDIQLDFSFSPIILRTWNKTKTDGTTQSFYIPAFPPSFEHMRKPEFEAQLKDLGFKPYGKPTPTWY